MTKYLHYLCTKIFLITFVFKMAAKNMPALKTQGSFLPVYISTYKRVCVCMFITALLLTAKKTIPACVCWEYRLYIQHCTIAHGKQGNSIIYNMTNKLGSPFPFWGQSFFIVKPTSYYL